MVRKARLITASVVVVLLLATVSSVSATKGSAELYLYTFDGTSYQLVGTDVHGFYEVYPGQKVYVQLVNIEPTFDWVQVRISYQEIPGEATVLGLFDVVGGTIGPSPQTMWQVPEEAVPCFTYVVQYRPATSAGPLKSSTYIASSPGISRPAHLHVVPEYPFGTLGALSVLLISIGIYSLLRKQRPPVLLKA